MAEILGRVRPSAVDEAAAAVARPKSAAANDETDGAWRTIHGAHVFISHADGTILKGPASLLGKSSADLARDRALKPLGGDYAARFHKEADFLDTTLGSRSNPIDCGADIEKAARLIADGKHVTLNQPDEVATLIDKIKVESEAARANGTALPNWNLAAISVKGTNLFAQDNVGVPRVEMPQLAGYVDPGSKADALLPRGHDPHAEVDLTHEFINTLRQQGIRVKTVEVLASHLRATQSELDGSKVASLAEKMLAGKVPKGYIFITRDRYICDGHHRWAATMVNDARDNHIGDLKMPAYELDIDIGRALTLARDFQREWGISPAKVSGAKSAGWLPATTRVREQLQAEGIGGSFAARFLGEDWDEGKHPRVSAGSATGGQFANAAMAAPQPATPSLPFPPSLPPPLRVAQDALHEPVRVGQVTEALTAGGVPVGSYSDIDPDPARLARAGVRESEAASYQHILAAQAATAAIAEIKGSPAFDKLRKLVSETQFIPIAQEGNTSMSTATGTVDSKARFLLNTAADPAKLIRSMADDKDEPVSIPASEALRVFRATGSMEQAVGTLYKLTMFHEAGHLLDDVGDNALTRLLSQTLVANFGRDAGYYSLSESGTKFLREKISEYASTSLLEATAECVTKVLMGEHLPPELKTLETVLRS